MGLTIWLIITVILIVVEIITLGLTSIWFAGGAFVAGLISLTGAQHFVCVQSVQCSRINLSKTIILKNNVRNPLNLCKIDGFLFIFCGRFMRGVIK